MKDHTQQPIEMMTRRELATRWRVSTETLKRKERAGLLPALKIGRGVRYRIADVLEYEEGAAV